MKAPTFIVTALLGLASASSSTELPTANITISGDNVTALGASTPFYPCKGFALDNNIFDIKEVILDPNPPRKGSDVKIVVRGHVNQGIANGAYIKATVKKGVLKHSFNFDFCQGVQAGCPVAAGDVEFWTGKHVPKLAPGGKAKIYLRPYTVDERIMGCVEVPVTLVK
ncbi:Phosphatidylglycerol/phosphatidylinositol transfer protein [Gnomoniopsis sp. IMI 355080]|nr:Phosphatidylglycerol/phosphatidylinositol transfer protein [Gnomoniopsis sp. IMI 355080]